MDTFVFLYISPILAVLMVMLNSAEIILIARKKGKLLISMIYLLNLSVSDLLTGIIIIFTKVLHIIDSPKLSAAYDVAVYSMLRLSILMSSLSLIVITLDRYFAVISPFRYRHIKRVSAVAVCITLWVFATVIIVVIKLVIVFKPEHIDTRYLDLLFPVIIFPTSCVLGAGYYLIIRTLGKVRMDLRPKVMRETEISLSVEKKGHINEIRITKLTISIIIVYVICWFPISIICMYSVFGIKNNIYRGLFNLCFCIALLNSCLNPIMYFNNLRQNVNKIFRQVKEKISSVVGYESSQQHVDDPNHLEVKTSQL